MYRHFSTVSGKLNGCILSVSRKFQEWFKRGLLLHRSKCIVATQAAGGIFILWSKTVYYTPIFLSNSQSYHTKKLINLVLSYFSFGIEDAKSILPPPDKKSWKRWDGTTYHGSSILALSYLFNRFSYSLIYCNNAINCFAVR